MNKLSTPKGDPGALRALNRRTVLNLVRRLGPVSRTQLAELTGLSNASITGVTAEFIEDRLLVEKSVGEAGATGGRRPIYLDIDYQAHFAVGLKLNEQRLEGVVTDLSLKVLSHQIEDLQAPDPERVAVQVASMCKRLYRQARVKPEDVIGLGMGLPGVVDALAGIAVHIPVLGWRGIAIGQVLEKSTGLGVWVDNDVNSFAAAQRLFGHAKHAHNFLAVAIGRGLGAALVSNGEIHRGRDGGAGEFGHNLVQPGGRKCSCGRLGCLEAYTTERAILAQFVERNPRRSKIAIAELVKLAETENKDAQEALATAGTLLGTHLAYLVNAFNPELIVVGGEGAALGPSYFEPLRQALYAHAYDGLAENLPLIVVPWDKDDFTPWTQGAASLAVQNTFDTGALLSS